MLAKAAGAAPANALFLCADRAMFPAAVFAAHTARTYAGANSFAIFMAVPENAVEPAWIDWAEANAGVHVKEVAGLERRLGMTRTGLVGMPLSTCLRFLFDLVVPSACKRLLYLDADVRVSGDLSRLFDLDLGTHLLAACHDGPVMTMGRDGDTWYGRYMSEAGHDPDIPYFNAGVMLIDAVRWQHEGVSDKVLANMRDNLDRYRLADQSALNATFRGAFQPLSPVWNFMTQLSPGGELSGLVEPRIIHFAGTEKPWKVTTWSQDDTEPAHYRTFFRQTPWRHFCSPWSQSPTWKQLRRFAKRRFRERVLGTPPRPRWLPGCREPMLARYRAHIGTFDFADVRQGLALRDGGVLRAV
jgi:hypothetical protein